MSKKEKQIINSLPTSEGAAIMAKLMEYLQKVETETPESVLNESSMNDNNGDRIIYMIIEGTPYIFNGDKKKTFELFRLLEDSLTPLPLEKKAVNNKNQVRRVKKLRKQG